MEKFNYAVTVKKTRRPQTKQHYLDYLDRLGDYGEIGNVRFETTRGLHVHFSMVTNERLDYRVLKPEPKGWNAKAVPIYNRKGWIRYVRKDEEKNRDLNADLPFVDDERQTPHPDEFFKIPKIRLF